MADGPNKEPETVQEVEELLRKRFAEKGIVMDEEENKEVAPPAGAEDKPVGDEGGKGNKEVEQEDGGGEGDSNDQADVGADPEKDSEGSEEYTEDYSDDDSSDDGEEVAEKGTEDHKPRSQSLREWLTQVGVADIDELEDEELESLILERVFGEPDGDREEDTRKPSGKDQGQSSDVDNKGSGIKQEAQSSEVQQGDLDAARAAATLTKQEENASGRKVTRLEYDPSWEEMVTENENGEVVPKPEYGEKGIEAAQKIKQYVQEYRERHKMLASDPIGFLEEDISRIVSAEVEKRLQEHEKKLQEAEKKRREEDAMKSEEQKIAALLDARKADLYKLNPDGTIKRLLKDSRPAMTEFGKTVDAEFLELMALNPRAPQSVLLEKAIKIAEKIHRPVETKKPDRQEKRKRFLQDRNNKSEPPEVSSERPATTEEKGSIGAAESLWEAIINDPDNEGIAGLHEGG